MEKVPSPVPFTDSRRLLGANPYFGATGAALETCGIAIDAALLDAWRARIGIARTALGWDDADVFAQAHASGATLALAAPCDQLFAATDANEWAWLASACSAGREAGFPRFHAPGYAAAWDEPLALATLRLLAAGERNPALVALAQAASTHAVALLVDDDALTLGEGVGARSFPPAPTPDAATLDWQALHDIPVALVTGTNGKTTTVRLLAAIARAHGWRTGYSCTDGLFVDGAQLDAGDYSGPAGARTVLRRPEVQAAILETARGGILRRGLAVQRVRTAVVTNLSPDHYGAYGVHDLDGLARVKLAVARVVASDGLLVLNADDPTLRAHAGSLDAPIGWFALDDAGWLDAQRSIGGATCGVEAGRIVLHVDGFPHDLGAIIAMPLTSGGHARYNIANLLAAALGAHALGIAPATIAGVFARFGAAHADNPGRLQRWTFGGIDAWLDYAHNPDGLRGLLAVALAERDTRRVGLLLGQAGDRSDDDLRALAGAAALHAPARVVLKDIAGMLRGRVAGESAGVLRDALAAAGIGGDAVSFRGDEADAARDLLAWARPGDILVLPIHGKNARPQVAALLDRLAAAGWRAGEPMPVE